MVTQMPSLCWHNGQIVETTTAAPSVASMSLHMGLAVFDGLMAYRNGNDYLLYLGEEHFDRLLRGCDRMGFPVPWQRPALLNAARSLLAACPAKPVYYVRPIAYRGAEHLWLTGIEDVPVDLSIIALPVARDVDTSVRMHVSPVRRVSSAAIPVSWKVSGTYANSYLCKKTAAAAGFDDGLMLDTQGDVAEASAANIFFISGDLIRTPALSGDVFPGETRRKVMELAGKLGYRVDETTIRPEDLCQFDAAFITSTLLELRPISEIQGHRMPSQANPVFTSLLQAFRDTTHCRQLAEV